MALISGHEAEIWDPILWSLDHGIFFHGFFVKNYL